MEDLRESSKNDERNGGDDRDERKGQQNTTKANTGKATLTKLECIMQMYALILLL